VRIGAQAIAEEVTIQIACPFDVGVVSHASVVVCARKVDGSRVGGDVRHRNQQEQHQNDGETGTPPDG
jgi:hypothetical protein